MSNPADSVLIRKPKSSRFDLSHDVKTSANFGSLIPVHCREYLAGTTFKLSSEVFLRAMPLVTPVMHNVNVYLHTFYCPYRILWRKWDDFLRGGKDNQTDIPKPVFRLTVGEYNTYIAHSSHIGDYFGLPKTPDKSTTSTDPLGMDISALPFMAYQYIYETYFADENLEDLIFDEVRDYVYANPVITSSSTLTIGSNTIYLLDWLTQIRNRCWEHDYFTSALPNTQRGADVHLPLYGSAPLVNETGASKVSQIQLSSGGNPAQDTILGLKQGSKQLRLQGVTDDTISTDFRAVDLPYTDFPGQVNVTGHTYVDLSAALGATINDFREALQLQKYNEIVQRTGNRVKEWMLGIFGVNVPDYRLELPEYIGGGKAPIVISEVLQQSQTTESSPQGTMSGRGVAAGLFRNKTRYLSEFGVVIQLMSILPRSSYQQGMPKMFIKSDRFDYGLPIFAELGEQAVLAGELYWANDGKNGDTFGYMPRYSEYKFQNSLITGQMRETLSDWHLGRIFQSRPVLNRDFVHTDEDDLNRIFAVEDPDLENQVFICQLFHHLKIRQPLPYHVVPI